jgi:hypothetical protein
MGGENARDSGLCLLSSDDCWVTNHPSRQATHTLTGWRRYGVAPKAAAVQRQWLNLRKTPSAHSRLARNGPRCSQRFSQLLACLGKAAVVPVMSVGLSFHDR